MKTVDSSSNLIASYPDLKGRSVFISGGATGIGAAIVEAYAKQGAKTAFVDLDESAGNELATRLNAAGYTVRFDHCDITNIKDYQGKIHDAAEAFGRKGDHCHRAGAWRDRAGGQRTIGSSGS